VCHVPLDIHCLTAQRAGAEPAVKGDRRGRFLEIDLEDLGREPFSELARSDRPAGDQRDGSVNRVTLPQQHRYPADLVIIHARSLSSATRPRSARC
jgi:hypothetical protein